MEQFGAVASVIASASGALQRLQLLIARERPDGPLARRHALSPPCMHASK
jgi:septum formation topological specificity factor MinE